MKQTSDIDIVYLWVNGDDPVWRAKRDDALSGASVIYPPALHANVAGRYRDNDELRFNLRALEYFFPEHGHIYIVTDEQIPDWLLCQDGISLICHTDLMPAQALPVFDSGHIESYLHHIQGLSERFIYLNDDVFFGARFDETLWFGQTGATGLAVFYETEQIPEYSGFQASETALVNASILSKQWLRQRYPAYQHENYILRMLPDPWLRV